MADDKQPDILSIARDRYKRGIEAEDANRKHALEAIKFRNLEQWDERVRAERENDPEGPRPCLVVDKTNQYLRQVCNDERQNRPAIRVRPVDDKGDPEVAEIFQGIVRHIEDRSGADIAYDTAYEQAADGGFGYFRVLTEYEDEMSFQQDILIKRIRNRFQVVLDPDRQEPDGSDAKWGFIVDKMSREEFKATYPSANALDFDAKENQFPEWVFEKDIIIAEYLRIEPVEKTVCLWASGRVTVKDEGKDVSADPSYVGDKIVKERKTKVNTVKWSKITAKDELDKREWPGKYIPIVEVIGNELDIEGKSVKSGLLKGAMEPARIHNYAASAFVENVALAPKAPWVAARGQVEGNLNDWRTANRRNLSVLTYEPVVMEGGVAVPAPQRTPPPGIPVGWQQTLMNTEHDIEASMGMYAQNTLGLGNAQSGKQEMLQQRRGDTANFHFVDNLSRSIRHLGRILVDLIPKIYDTERAARILGEDGTSEMAALDPNQQVPVMEKPDGEGKVKKIYNLGVGKYDVTVTVGPAFATKRQEAAEFMVQSIQAVKDPATAQVLTYLAIKNNDFAGADEATKMLKKLLPPQVLEGEEGEEVPHNPQDVAVIQQLQGQLQEAMGAVEKAGNIEAEGQQLESQKVELQAEMGRLEAAKRELELREKLALANIAREKAEAENELLKMQQPEVIAANAASQAVDGVMNLPVG
jgi:hypothetical protein